MIYASPAPEDPIRQGDIFIGLPRIEVSLNEMLLYTEGQVVLKDWHDVASENESTIVVGVRSVVGVVVSQDCDLVRARDVVFCEVRPFRDVEGKSKETSSPKSRKNIITQQARLNLKWFYLPPDIKLGFEQKMAADFQVLFRVPREELEKRRATLRKGRLNDLSESHFRERIGEFFRRYPYDEWYPLDSAELDAYLKEYPEAKKFPWQEP